MFSFCIPKITCICISVYMCVYIVSFVLIMYTYKYTSIHINIFSLLPPPVTNKQICSFLSPSFSSFCEHDSPFCETLLCHSFHIRLIFVQSFICFQ